MRLSHNYTLYNLDEMRSVLKPQKSYIQKRMSSMETMRLLEFDLMNFLVFQVLWTILRLMNLLLNLKELDTKIQKAV